MKAIGPRSRPTALAKLDRRTKAGRHLRRVRDELTAHLGENISIVQRDLIDRAAWLSLHIFLADMQTIRGKPMSEITAKTYLASVNTYARILARLGLDAASDEKEAPDLSDYLAQQQEATQ